MRCHLPTLVWILILFVSATVQWHLVTAGGRGWLVPPGHLAGRPVHLGGLGGQQPRQLLGEAGLGGGHVPPLPCTWHVTRDTTTPWPRPRGTWVRVQVVEEGRGVAGELGGVAAPRVRVLVVRQPAATCPHVCLVLPTPGQSCKLRFPKITRRFHNHGEGPYKDLLLVKIAY